MKMPSAVIFIASRDDLRLVQPSEEENQLSSSF